MKESNTFKDLIHSIMFLASPLILTILFSIILGGIISNIQIATLVVITVANGLVLGYATFKRFQFPNFGAVKGGKLIIYASAGVVFYFLGLMLSNNFESIPNISTIQYSDGIVYYLIGAILMAPILEEVIFRGIGYQFLLNHRFSIPVSVILTSLLFSIGHLPGIFSFINTLVLGIILSFVYVRENNLIYSIILHLVYNVLSTTLIVGR